MRIDIIGVATHQLVLYEIISRTNKPILELGAGDHSTPQIHKLARDRKIVTIEDNHEWFNRYKSLHTMYHTLLLMNVNQMKDFFDNDNIDWGLVFIDSTDWNMRILAINKYKDIADYIIIHDSGYAADNNIFGRTLLSMNVTNPGRRDFSDTFKYWVEYMPKKWRISDPPTLLASNKIDVRDVPIKSMMISNMSK